MPRKRKPTTVGALRKSRYKPLSVKQEMRKNLIHTLKNGAQLFPGIIGFEDTVIPHLETALLAGQDIILLGERGQAKSRLIRHLVSLLDEEIPFIAGCELNDSPYDPICRACKEKLAAGGGDVEIDWLPREERYSEKLSTPDISVADLIGEIDPIKVAEGRYLSDELTIHYGLIPRTNRGIFSINELPDLSERIQVSLFNLMEERDIQIKGYRIMLPLDIFLVATANPEDYTNRGRIITPLKDRYGAPDPHPLPHQPGRRDGDRGAGVRQLPRRVGAGDGAAVHEGSDRGDHVTGAPQPRDQPALGRQPARVHCQLRDPAGLGLQAGPASERERLAESQRLARYNRLNHGEDRAGERGGGGVSTRW